MPEQTPTLEQLPRLRVEFAGEWHDVDPTRPFAVGREGDLAIDDNQYLHRTFLQVTHQDGLWWLANVGSRLAATVTSVGGAVQTWLSPGASVPIVFEECTVVFTAGPTTYEVGVYLDGSQFRLSEQARLAGSGEATIAPARLTQLQTLLIVSLAEPMLKREGVGVSELPSSAQAAERLGWTITKFNRKLDNVCEKLDRMGVQGLRAGGGKLASSRKARLVEYAVTTHLVTRADLPMLEDARLLSQD